MVHFEGVEYRKHTSCISEAQKYQGKLYKEKKGPNSKPAATSQALVPKKQMETPPEADNRVALVDAPPRAPSPPPGDYNVFDFLIMNGDTPAPSAHPKDTPVSSPSSSESEDSESDSDSMDAEDDDDPDTVEDSYEAARDYMKQELLKQGYAYGTESGEQTFERFQSYAQLPPSPAGQSGQLPIYTPAPTRGHQRNISAASMDSATKESNKKRKRGSPDALDLSSARAYQNNGDVVMTDVQAPLHSGLTGGLNRMLARPELPPSPPDMDGSPISPIKRSRHSKDTDKKSKDKKKAEKALKEKLKKADTKKDKLAAKEKEKKEYTVVKDPKTGQWVRRRSRKEPVQQSPEEKEQPAKRQMRAIEYHPTVSSPLLATPSNALVLHSAKSLSRAELFLTTAAKDSDTGKGCSINKALKRYHRERAARKVGEEEKELWKVLRLRKNDRGEIVVFIPDGVEA